MHRIGIATDRICSDRDRIGCSPAGRDWDAHDGQLKLAWRASRGLGTTPRSAAGDDRIPLSGLPFEYSVDGEHDSPKALNDEEEPIDFGDPCVGRSGADRDGSAKEVWVAG